MAEDFITYNMSIPAGRRGQDVSYVRHTQNVAKSIYSLLNNADSGKDTGTSGYTVAFDPETKKVNLTFTSPASEASTVASALRQASIYRGKGAYSPTAKKGLTIEQVPTEYSSIPLEGISDRAKASLAFDAMNTIGDAAAGDSVLNIPSNIKYASSVSAKIKMYQEQQIKKDADVSDVVFSNIKKLNFLRRDRKDRAIAAGVPESSLPFTVPEGNTMGIDKDFVDKQNEMEKSRKEQARKEAGAVNDKFSTPLAFIALYKAVTEVVSVLRSIYKVAKEGMDKAAAASLTSLSVGLTAQDIMAANQADLRYNLKEGTTASGYQALLGGLNTPFGLNTKMIESLAILGSAASDKDLVKSAINTAVSGQNVSVIYSKIMEDARSVISSGKDLTGKQIGQAESTRVLINYLNSNGMGALASALAGQQQSARNSADDFVYKAGGISTSLQDVEGATAAKSSANQLQAGIESISVKLASWFNSTHILDSIYRLLLSWKGTESDKAEYAVHIQQQNKENASAARETISNIRSTPEVKKIIGGIQPPDFMKVPLSMIRERGIGEGATGLSLQDIVNTVQGNAPDIISSSLNPGDYVAGAINRIAKILDTEKNKYTRGSNSYNQIEQLQQKLFALKSAATVQAELSADVRTYTNNPTSTNIDTMTPQARISRGLSSAYLGVDKDFTIIKHGYDTADVGGYKVPLGNVMTNAYVQQIAQGILDNVLSRSLVTPEETGKVNIDWKAQLQLMYPDKPSETKSVSGKASTSSGKEESLVIDSGALRMSSGQSSVFSDRVKAR